MTASLLLYKIVPFDVKTGQGYSAFDPSFRHDLKIGTVWLGTAKGLYLANKKSFCLDFYSGMSDDPDVLLTFEVDPKDVLNPEGLTPPHLGDEVLVRKAKLVKVEHVGAVSAFSTKAQPTLDFYTSRGQGSRMTSVSGMAVLLRGVSRHDWGFYSREDERLHIQTVDSASYKGRRKAKVFLEEQGKRVFLVDMVGDMTRSEFKDLLHEVQERSDEIEHSWVEDLEETGKLTIALRGDEVLLTVFPGTHNKRVVPVSLRELFPAVDSFDDWVATFDRSLGALAIGSKSKAQDRRHHLRVEDFLFHGDRESVQF